MIDTLLQLLFPERCLGCRLPGTALCPTCLSAIPRSRTIYSMPQALALYEYTDPIVRKAVWNLKYKHRSPAAKVLTIAAVDRIARLLSFLPARGPVILVPLPQHYTKTFSRGFNQSASIARWVKELLPGVRVEHLIKKVRATTPQAQAGSKAGRLSNLHESMQVRNAAAIQSTAVYILIDDVITTGGTVNEASRALRAAGAEHVYAIALAHGSAKV